MARRPRLDLSRRSLALGRRPEASTWLCLASSSDEGEEDRKVDKEKEEGSVENREDLLEAMLGKQHDEERPVWFSLSCPGYPNE